MALVDALPAGIVIAQLRRRVLSTSWPSPHHQLLKVKKLPPFPFKPMKGSPLPKNKEKEKPPTVPRSPSPFGKKNEET
jgi:hypothetical protein